MLPSETYPKGYLKFLDIDFAMSYVQHPYESMFKMAEICIPTFAYCLEAIPYFFCGPVSGFVVLEGRSVNNEMLFYDPLEGIRVEKVSNTNCITENGLP